MDADAPPVKHHIKMKTEPERGRHQLPLKPQRSPEGTLLPSAQKEGTT